MLIAPQWAEMQTGGLELSDGNAVAQPQSPVLSNAVAVHEGPSVSPTTAVEPVDKTSPSGSTANKGTLPCGSRCGRAFDRACDRRKHEKIHQPQQARPHPCDTCSKRFWYPKDLKRHAKLHEHKAGLQHLVTGTPSS